MIKYTTQIIGLATLMMLTNAKFDADYNEMALTAHNNYRRAH